MLTNFPREGMHVSEQIGPIFILNHYGRKATETYEGLFLFDVIACTAQNNGA